MKKFLLALAALPSLAMALPAPEAARLRDAALNDDVAWQIVEGLTTDIGARPAGSDAEARAREWAVARLRALGFQNVRIDAFQVDGWERGTETAQILGASPQNLTISALGYSGATPAQGLSAEIAQFSGIEALKSAPDSAVAGKIVFITHRMTATQDGSSYRAVGPIRFDGPAIAARKGAVAVLIRSLGTGRHRLPHTGVIEWYPGQAPIAAAALSIPDAEQLERLIAKGAPIRMRLVLTPRLLGKKLSGNVIAELPGRDPDTGIILVGGHLDSWDQGTGAIDDAAGVGIVTDAARLAAQGTPLLRTIRVVWFGSEEIGNGGDMDYLRRHGSEKYAMAGESDFGADRVWRFDTRHADLNSPEISRVAALLEPLGIARGGNDADGGPDVAPLKAKGVPMVSLRQDGSRYFELHHTADDTLDKVDPVQLRQNVAAWTALLAVAARAPNWPEKAAPTGALSPE